VHEPAGDVGDGVVQGAVVEVHQDRASGVAIEDDVAWIDVTVDDCLASPVPEPGSVHLELVHVVRQVGQPASGWGLEIGRRVRAGPPEGVADRCPGHVEDRHPVHLPGLVRAQAA
jgi:hypothetical protein